MDFQEAALKVKSLKKRPDNATLLQLYALFKQGSEGDATGERPGPLDLKTRAKFDAWKGLSGLSQDEAQARYVALATSLLEQEAV